LGLQNLDTVVLAVGHKVLPGGTLDGKRRSAVVFCAVIGLLVMLLFYALVKNMAMSKKQASSLVQLAGSCKRPASCRNRK
jgi:hypothetical protein